MPIPVIIDTDIDTDCDDVGALAVLHALSKLGEASILGVVCSIPHPATAACVRVINRHYGRDDIPIGLLRDEDLMEGPRYDAYRRHLKNADGQGWQRYNEAIAVEFGEPIDGQMDLPDAVTLYRKLLAMQPDHSVSIVAIGLLTALQKLLSSAPDEFSALSGAELVARKVARTVTMGIGSFPIGKDVFNWWMDREAAAAVLNGWPATLVVSEWGTDVLTGKMLGLTQVENHPVRRAYEVYLGGAGLSRSSWDQIALLYAVRGVQNDFEEVTGYRLRFDPVSGEHAWYRGEAEQGNRVYLKQLARSEDLASTIEELMALAP